MAIVCVDEYHALARDRIAAHNCDYIEGGSGAELTVDANRQVFDAVRLRPRMLTRELTQIMALAGRPRLADVDRSALLT